MNGRLGIAAVASVIVHAAVAVPFVAVERESTTPRPRLVPLDIVEAPTPPPPPDPDANPSPPPPLPAPKPKPKADPKPRPKPSAPKIKREPGTVLVSDAGPAADASMGDLARTDAFPRDAGVSTDDDAGHIPDAGSTPGELDAGTATPPFDPAIADLRSAVPPGERVVLVLRTDRLRGTPWAEAIEAILAPLPDHRRILEGTGLTLADTFDIFVVASSQPRDITQTFLAGRAAGDETVLRRILARPAPGSSVPRVTWNSDPLGTRGLRSEPRDPRVFLVPDPGWFLLVRPELVPAARPPWLDGLVHIDDVTRDDKLLGVVTAADFGVPTLQLPGGSALPAPERVTVAVRVEANGLIVTGAAVFSSAAHARGFRVAVETAQATAIASITRRFILRTIGLSGAVARLALRQSGDRVTFSTSLSNDEALTLLDQAASMSRRFFLHEP